MVKVEELMAVVLRHIISDSSRPPQIVELPEAEFLEAPMTLVINKRTADVLDSLAKQFGTSRERVARSILHSLADIVDVSN